MELRDPKRYAQVRAALLAELDAARELDFGLGAELDTDLALACTTALAVLAAGHDQAAELHGVLLLLDGRADAGEDPGGDLAQAQAAGVTALAQVPFWDELEPEERRALIGAALETAERIAPPSRDHFGCVLARLLHDELVRAHEPAAATAVLARELPRFADDLVERPYLVYLLAEELRTAQRWSEAWDALGMADLVLARPEELGHEAKTLQCLFAGARCRLELGLGLVDRALESYAVERRAFVEGARDLDSKLAVLLDGSNVAMAANQKEILERTAQLLVAELADPQFLHDLPALRAQLDGRRALLECMLARASGVRSIDVTALEAAAQAPALAPTQAALLSLYLAGLGLEGRTTLEHAAQALARLERLPQDALPDELRAAAVGARVLLALAGGARGAELEPLEALLAPKFEAFLAARAAAPWREGGLGYLTFRNRVMLLGARLALDLAQDGGGKRALEHVLAVQHLGTLARALNCEAGSVAELRAELLAPGRAILLYVPNATGLTVFYFDPENILHEHVSVTDEIESAARDLGHYLATSPAPLSASQRALRSAGIEGALGRLAVLIPAAFRPRIAKLQGLYIVGGGLLDEFPFECLELDGEALGRKQAISYLPSLPVGLELARRAKKDATAREFEQLLVAAPTLAPEARSAFPRLTPFELDDGQFQTLGSKERNTRILSGPDASFRKMLASLRADPPSLLHFLVHGVNDYRRELGSALALAPDAPGDDGLAWTEELLGADFASPPLVALTSCGSARGPRRMGDDGMAVLSAAFFTHGTRCTLQASSDLALAPSAVLMGVFTRGVSSGLSPAEAMRRARAELGRDAELQDPFYSLSVRVVGLGLEPVHPTQR